jgi:hypothetical protein
VGTFDLKDLKKCPNDPNSYTNCDELITTHFHLNFTVDFNASSLIGSNLLNVTAQKDDVKSLILDYQGLVITKVEESTDNGVTFKPATYSTAQGRWGNAVSVNLQNGMINYQ